MANSEKTPVTIQELLISSLASTDACEALHREGIITEQKYLQKISEERARYQRMLNPTAQCSPTRRKLKTVN
jgi:hypothetical protein